MVVGGETGTGGIGGEGFVVGTDINPDHVGSFSSEDRRSAPEGTW